MNEAPNWAWKLTKNTLNSEGIRRLPDLIWQDFYKWDNACGSAEYNIKQSGGRHKNSITILAGTSRKYNKFILLHELAHLITREGHTDHFWDKVLDIYKQHRFTNAYILKDQHGGYRKGLLNAINRRRKRR